jgi:hypothetical protein
VIVYKITNVIDADYYIGYTGQTKDFFENSCYGSGLMIQKKIINFLCSIIKQLESKKMIEKIYNYIFTHKYTNDNIDLSKFNDADIPHKDQIINILKYILSTDHKMVASELLVLLKNHGMIIFKKEILFQSEDINEIKRKKEQLIKQYLEKDSKHCLIPPKIIHKPKPKKEKIKVNPELTSKEKSFIGWFSKNYKSYRGYTISNIENIYYTKIYPNFIKK